MRRFNHRSDGSGTDESCADDMLDAPLNCVATWKAAKRDGTAPAMYVLRACGTHEPGSQLFITYGCDNSEVC